MYLGIIVPLGIYGLLGLIAYRKEIVSSIKKMITGYISSMESLPISMTVGK